MKNLITITILVFSFNLNSSSQTYGWFVNQITPEKNLAVHFIDENIGFVTGDYGSGIYRTLNGGEDWDYQAFGSYALRDISFINQNYGWVTAHDGVLKTTDGGITWEHIPHGFNVQMYCIEFVNEFVGFAGIFSLNGIKAIIKSVDGGNTWQISYNGTSGIPRKIQFVNENTGFFSDQLYVYKTNNAGDSWEIIESTGNCNRRGMFFYDESFGWHWSDNYLRRTIDGGTTWETVYSIYQNDDFNDVYFISPDTGIVGIPNNPSTYITYDGGNSMEYGLIESEPVSVQKISLININLGWAVGRINGLGGEELILKYGILPPQVNLISPNGGEQFQIGTSDTIQWENINVDNINLEYSINNGNTWSLIEEDMPDENGYYLWQIPDSITTQGKVKITDSDNDTVIDINDNSFVIYTPVPFTKLKFYGDVEINPTNPHNLVEPGRFVRLKTMVTNNLVQNLLTLKGVLKSMSQYITVIDSSGTFNNILAGESGWSADEFEIYIDPNTPNDTYCELALALEDEIITSGPWTSYFVIPIVINPFDVSNNIIDDDEIPDSNGNNNDIVEPGETIEIIPLIDNISSHYFLDILGILYTLHPEINIWNNVQGATGIVYDHYPYGDIGIGAQNIPPEQDFVFTNNFDDIYSLDFEMILVGYLDYFSDLELRWHASFTMNDGYPNPPTSINENEDIEYISIFPNPADTKIFLSSKSKINSCILYSIDGTRIYSSQLSNGISEIDISEIKQGVYFLICQTIDNKKSVNKIVIK